MDKKRFNKKSVTMVRKKHNKNILFAVQARLDDALCVDVF